MILRRVVPPAPGPLYLHPWIKIYKENVLNQELKLVIKLHAKGTVNIVLTDSQQCPLTFNGSRYVAGIILVFLRENGLSFKINCGFSTKVNCGYIERVFS